MNDTAGTRPPHPYRLGTAAGAIAKDEAKTKAVAVIVHGNPTGFGRENERTADWLEASDVSSVVHYPGDLKIVGNLLKRAVEKGNELEIQSRQGAIDKYKNENQAVGKLSDQFMSAATALKAAKVSTVELQGCNVGNDLFLKDQVGALLSSEGSQVKVGAFSTETTSRDNPGRPEAGVSEGPQSATTLPKPDRN